MKLVSIMQQSVLTRPENLERLKMEIYKFTQDSAFKESQSMGDIMKACFDFVRRHYQKENLYNLF